MNQIYVLGSDGQLGRSLQMRQPEWIYLTRKDVDLSDNTNIESYFKNKNADVILNLAAYTQVDKAETEKDLAMQINGHASGALARSAKHYIYVSTDYVFSGQNTKPYKETDSCAPQGAYGESKLLGETLALKENPNTYVIRTSWLYSEFGHNFLKTMLRLGTERKELNVVSDQIGTPTYAGDLAEVLQKLVGQLPQTKPGIYHYSNDGICSWCDFSKEIFKIQDMQVTVNPIPTTAYPTLAKRPGYSVLDKTKIKAALNIEVPNWQSSLRKCLENLSR